jgi:hypothetical protein
MLPAPRCGRREIPRRSPPDRGPRRNRGRRTYAPRHSAQGRITSLAPASAVERDRAEEYTDAFFGDITRTDGTDRSVLNRMKPVEYIACVTRFAEIYDQTPGPVAGAAIHGNVP